MQSKMVITDDMKKKFAFGFPNSYADKDIAEFGEYFLVLCKEQKYTRDTLSDVFYEYFGSFTEDMFNLMPSVTRRSLRDHLRKNGVYVPKVRSIKIPTALMETVKDDPKWPSDDPENPDSEHIGDEASTANITAPPTAERKVDVSLPTSSVTQTANNNDRPDVLANREFTRPARPSYAITNLVKSYSNREEKYSGSFDDNFDRKLAIFNEKCEQSGVLVADRKRVLSAMLSCTTLQYYLDVIKPTNCDFEHAIQSLRLRFITRERILSLTREWEKIKLIDYLKSNPDISPKLALTKMISRLQELQGCSPRYFRNDEIFINKLPRM